MVSPTGQPVTKALRISVHGLQFLVFYLSICKMGNDILICSRGAGKIGLFICGIVVLQFKGEEYHKEAQKTIIHHSVVV